MLHRFFSFLALLTSVLMFLPSLLKADELDCAEPLLPKDAYAETYNLSYNATPTRSDNAYSNRYLELDGRNTYKTSQTDTFGVYYRGQKILEDKTSKYVAMQLEAYYKKKFCLRDALTLNLTGLYGAPVNRELVKYDHSRGQIASKTDLSWSEGEDGLSFSFLTVFRRHFFAYTDNAGGLYLKQYSFEPAFTISYVWKDLELSVTGVDYMGWDFSGEQLRSEYYHEEALSYQITEKWSVGFAHRSDGLLANYGGSGYDIHLHDKDRSELAFTVGFSE